MNLYPHQAQGIDAIRFALRDHRRVAYQLPTGGGKTVMFCYMASRAKVLPVYIIVHRVELVEQVSATLEQWGVWHSHIAAGYKYDRDAGVFICMVQSLSRRIERVPRPSLVVVDEFHHAASDTYTRALNHWPTAKVVGVTATPIRLDGKGLRQHADALVCGPSVREMIDGKLLSDYWAVVVKSDAAQLTGVHKRAGEYDVHEQAGMLKAIAGNVVEEYRQRSNGGRGLVFAPTIEYSKGLAERFCAAGIAAAHLDGDTPKPERKAVVQRYKDGELQVLTNVDLFSEGFDVPGASVLQMVRKTASLSRYLQMCGRVLRYQQDKKAIIIDHVGNVIDHGMPCEERTWTLSDTAPKAKGAAAPTKTCPECEAEVAAGVRECPHCQHVFPAAEVLEVPAEMVVIDAARVAYYRKRAQGQARTFSDLVELATSRGYKSPRTWAMHVMAGRRKKESASL